MFLYCVGVAMAGDKPENGTIPNEHTELMDKKERDSSIIKSDMDARSHVSGVSSHPSHSSHPSSHSSRRGYDKLNFPRHDLQTLGMLGRSPTGMCRPPGLLGSLISRLLEMMTRFVRANKSHSYIFVVVLSCAGGVDLCPLVYTEVYCHNTLIVTPLSERNTSFCPSVITPHSAIS